MKVLVLLALAIFSACNGNILRPAPPQTNQEQVRDAFWDYVVKETFPAEDSLEQIKQSELGQEVNARISKSAEAVKQYTSALRGQMTHLTADLLNKLSREVEQLKAHLEKDLSATAVHLRPYAEELSRELQRQTDQLRGDVTPYSEALGLDQVTPYAEELRRKVDKSLDEIQTYLRPLTQTFQDQLVQRAQEIQQSLSSYGEELKAKLNIEAQDLQSQLAALWDSFSKKIQ